MTGKKVLAGILVAVLVLGVDYRPLESREVQASEVTAVDVNEDETFVENIDETEECNVTDMEDYNASEPIAFSEEKMVNGVSVSVKADAGVFPSGSRLSVNPINSVKTANVTKAVDKIRDSDCCVVNSYCFDISILDENGQEIEPDMDNGTVWVSFASDEVSDPNLKVDVYHVIEEDGALLTAESLNISEEDDAVIAETDSFSYYMVEFSYDSLSYYLSVGSISLYSVLDAVGLSGNITNATSADETLLTVSKVNGNWTINATNMFLGSDASTTTALAVTISGVDYVIAVAPDTSVDAQNGSWLFQYDYDQDDTAKTITLTSYNPDSDYEAWKNEHEGGIHLVVPEVISEENTPGDPALWGYSVRLTGNVYDGFILNRYTAASKIKSIIFGRGVKFIGDCSRMFQHTTSMEKLDVSGIDTSDVTNMAYMFSYCGNPFDNELELDVSHFDTSNVTNMCQMFNNYRGEALDVSKFDTSKVEYMDGMFYCCTKLKKLDVSHFRTSNVIVFGQMFRMCYKLESLDLSNFDTSKAVAIAEMFADCNSLKTLDLSNFNTSRINPSAGNELFRNCPNLETIYVSEDWNLTKREDDTMDDTFFLNCYKLVGQNGTAYNEAHIGIEYAHIDKPGNPGYLTGITTTHSISGIVKDQNGNGLYGVPVKIGNKTATSQRDGSYAVNDLKDGTYTISVTYRGVTEKKDITIDGADKKVNVIITFSRPNPPIVTGWTDRFVYLRPVDGHEFNICRGDKWDDKKGMGWQSEGSFAGLIPGATYAVVSRNKSTNEISDGVVVVMNQGNGASAVVGETSYGDGVILSAVAREQGAPEMSFDNVGEAFLQSLLSEAERTAVQNGATMTVQLGVERKDRDDIPANDRALADERMRGIASGARVGMYLDMNFYKRVGGSGDTRVTDLKGHDLSVNVDVPKELQAPAGVRRTYYIIRVHDGKAELLMSSTSMSFGFRTDKFSTYTLAYNDEYISVKKASNPSVTSSASKSSSRSGGSGTTDGSASYTKGSGVSKAVYVKIGKGSVRYDTPLVGNKAKTVKIPATVKIGKKDFKVTSIASNAFIGYDKLNTVIIGKNIRKIEKEAFNGCDKLTVITINSKKLTAKKVKGAFVGSKIKTVYVPADKVDDYKKIFTKKITGSKKNISVKVKKK